MINIYMGGVDKLIKFLRGLTSALQTSNPIASDGQPIAEKLSSGYRLKIGDGKTSYNNLPYIQITMPMSIDNPSMHNQIYREKYLGNTVTNSQYQEISNGTFKDLYIGDYWTINNIDFIIAGFDYWYGFGGNQQNESEFVLDHHVVLTTGDILYNAQMFQGDSSSGGYANSYMFTTGLESARSTISSIFGSHILQHKNLLSDEITDSVCTHIDWYDVDVELPSQCMLFGSRIFNSENLQYPRSQTISFNQLPLYHLNKQILSLNQRYWTMDPSGLNMFVGISYQGYANTYNITESIGVRPIFSIK